MHSADLTRDRGALALAMTPQSVTRRRRVLHIIHSMAMGGMERVVADLIRFSDRTRFEMHVLGLQKLGPNADRVADCATLHRAVRMPRWSLIWPQTLASQIREIAPDVVHTHGQIWYKASLAARLAGVPRLVHTDHGRPPGPEPWISRVLERRAARRVDVIVAVSHSLAHQLSTSYAARAGLRVVINGVDTELHAPRADDGSVHAELGVAPGTPLIGSVGRLDPIKGHDVMVDAFACLLSSWRTAPAPVLVLVGYGTEHDSLRARAQRLGIASQVRWLGWRDDVARLHAAFALFTQSSRSEGTSISLLEAMSAGLCPVVTDVGGNAYVVGHALRHRLVPSESPKELADAWQSALLDPTARAEDGAAARRRIESEFGLRAMVRAYEKLYEPDHESMLMGETA
jgi:glycosyltransferase involved in cell wall biosynthesis